jgi:hypothetical protein
MNEKKIKFKLQNGIFNTYFLILDIFIAEDFL